MCGIAAIVGHTAQTARPLVERMMERMTHRGPDDQGIWTEGLVTLGHLRLSIIDTSDAGHQPMRSHDDRYVIVFNGEIFNYIELRKELISLGSMFRTQGDTEVILEAYRQWGENCVRHFNGMWAFVLWDKKERVLFASRDRFGVKPLYYHHEDGVLHFASEMKALLNKGKGSPNWAYFYHYFDRRTPLGSDATVFENVYHLRPGHNIFWKEGAFRLSRFWEPDPAYSRRTYDYGDPVSTLRELIMDAVKLRLRSDVPLGVCLSGGVDSSVIAVAMHALGVTPATFSVTYDEERYSEKFFMNAVNQRIGAVSHMHTPSSADFFPTLESIVSHHDEPVRMPGCFSHWHVMRCASEHVTVVLDGQGADEVFGGYADYYPSYIASLLRDIVAMHGPREATGHLMDCHKGITAHMGNERAIVMEAILRALPSAVRALARSPAPKAELFSSEFVQRYGANIADDNDEARFLERYGSVLDRDMRRTFVETNLPMLLRYEDRNSMAFSMEARVPFLDYRVVEFAQGLPYRLKMRGYTTKWIVREAFKDLLPPEVLFRTDKKGFPTPTALWFKGPLRTKVEQRILQGAFMELHMFDISQIQRLLREHMEGKADHERILFRLLTLDTWLRMYAHSSDFR